MFHINRIKIERAWEIIIIMADTMCIPQKCKMRNTKYKMISVHSVERNNSKMFTIHQLISYDIDELSFLIKFILWPQYIFQTKCSTENKERETVSEQNWVNMMKRIKSTNWEKKFKDDTRFTPYSNWFDSHIHSTRKRTSFERAFNQILSTVMFRSLAEMSTLLKLKFSTNPAN